MSKRESGQNRGGQSASQSHGASGGDDEPDTLVEVLDVIGDAAEGERTAVRAVVEAVGERGYAPLLLAPALLALTPAGVIPGLPTIMGVLVLLIAGQLVLGRERPWFPGFLLDLSVKTATLKKGLDGARKPAGWADKLLRRRLEFLTTKTASRVGAALIAVIAVAVPPLELVPFAVFAPALAITAFALGLVAKDGLLVLLSLVASAVTLGLVGYAFLK